MVSCEKEPKFLHKNLKLVETLKHGCQAKVYIVTRNNDPTHLLAKQFEGFEL